MVEILPNVHRKVVENYLKQIEVFMMLCFIYNAKTQTLKPKANFMKQNFKNILFTFIFKITKWITLLGEK